MHLPTFDTPTKKGFLLSFFTCLNPCSLTAMSHTIYYPSWYVSLLSRGLSFLHITSNHCGRDRPMFNRGHDCLQTLFPPWIIYQDAYLLKFLEKIQPYIFISKVTGCVMDRWERSMWDDTGHVILSHCEIQCVFYIYCTSQLGLATFRVVNNNIWLVINTLDNTRQGSSWKHSAREFNSRVCFSISPSAPLTWLLTQQ